MCCRMYNTQNTDNTGNAQHAYRLMSTGHIVLPSLLTQYWCDNHSGSLLIAFVWCEAIECLVTDVSFRSGRVMFYAS